MSDNDDDYIVQSQVNALKNLVFLYSTNGYYLLLPTPHHNIIPNNSPNLFNIFFFQSYLIFSLFLHTMFVVHGMFLTVNLCVPIFGYLTISGAPYLLITQIHRSKFKSVNSSRLSLHAIILSDTLIYRIVDGIELYHFFHNTLMIITRTHIMFNNYPKTMAAYLLTEFKIFINFFIFYFYF